jgi:hypothetical protein
MLATLIQTLDSTIANVALPHMQGTLIGIAGRDHLGADVLHRRGGYRHAAYGLALRSRLSTKRLLLTSIALVSRSRRRCAGYPRVLRRSSRRDLLQGVFGASLVPLSQSILLDINPREKQGQAMAVWGMGVMVGPDSRADAWRLAHRQLQLALGIFHQRADWRVRALWRGDVSCKGEFLKPGSKVRLFRLRHAQSRDRRVAGHARPRRAARLVRLARNPVRDARLRDQLSCSFIIAHRDRAASRHSSSTSLLKPTAISRRDVLFIFMMVARDSTRPVRCCRRCCKP